MKYFEEAKFIWKNYVHKNGQADTVQGELLKAIEKLRYEAQDNGNINWDDRFEMFCKYMWNTLSSWGKFSDETLTEIKNDLERIRDYQNPYVNNDLYDRLTDHAMEWYLQNKRADKKREIP
ncbi:hypothetical protein [Clostridium muellerianum]|uniref:hypothetical protein n=1 Tax=Clostridium muellerianum TaxID=2716538 RepID=UPI00197D4B06|nr:hypothetical protein [Clostridium muellerianum]